jgi:hypothetical protein
MKEINVLVIGPGKCSLPSEMFNILKPKEVSVRLNTVIEMFPTRAYEEARLAMDLMADFDKSMAKAERETAFENFIAGKNPTIPKGSCLAKSKINKRTNVCRAQLRHLQKKP